jgi:hypothetical protein
MKKLLMAALVMAAFAVNAAAQSPVKFSLFDQIAAPQTEKANLGLGLFYSNTPEVSGLDFNFFVSKVDNLTGVQLSTVNINDKGRGAHLGFVNYNTGDFTGLQWGFVNYANNFTGLQLGFVNYINTIDKGLQIGLVNIIKNNGWLPFMVIVNGRF